VIGNIGFLMGEYELQCSETKYLAVKEMKLKMEDIMQQGIL
jgi:hypothetical protein